MKKNAKSIRKLCKKRVLYFSVLSLMSVLLVVLGYGNCSDNYFKNVDAIFTDAQNNVIASFNLKVADTHEKRAKGLMNVKSLNFNEGMIFVYDKDIVMNFWMKNTYIPLDIVFLDKNYRIIGIIENMLPVGGNNEILDNDIPRYTINRKSRYAVEIPAFSVKKLGINVGDRLNIIANN